MAGKRVGIKAGCYTLLHAGHIYALEFAKSQVDYLIALTNTDDRIQRKHGCVPVSLNDRIRILAGLRCVDGVGFFPEATEDFWVAKFKESRLHKEFGLDARLIVFHDPAVSNNPPCKMIADEVVYIPRIDVSVTKIFDVIRRADKQ